MDELVEMREATDHANDTVYENTYDSLRPERTDGQYYLTAFTLSSTEAGSNADAPDGRKTDKKEDLVSKKPHKHDASLKCLQIICAVLCVLVVICVITIGVLMYLVVKQV